MATTTERPGKANILKVNAHRRTAALAREQQVLELRIRGYSYHQIAKELDISPSTAFTRCKSATDKLHEQVLKTADKLRTIQLERYDRMVQSLWDQAITPGARGQLHAMEQLIRVMERIDRVAGTEAPMRKIVWVVDESTLYAATEKLERETDEMEATLERRERQRAAIDAGATDVLRHSRTTDPDGHQP